MYQKKKFGKDVSLENYMVDSLDELESKDLKGFCTVGVLITKIINDKRRMLIAFEDRHDEIKGNLIGGKRDEEIETPWDVAKRELYEETKIVLNDELFHKIKHCCWIANSKYIIIHIDLGDDKKYENFPNPDEINLIPKIEELKWMPMKLKHDKFHSFAYEMLEYFLDMDIEEEIEN